MPTKKAIHEDVPPETLALIFKSMDKGSNSAGLVRGIVQALGYARNDYEQRLIVLALKRYADELDPPK